jgi:hypothetical protein
MAFVTNGAYRQTTLTVTTTLNGVDQPSKQYSILAAFPGYGAVTATDFSRLPDTAYQARLQAFLAWVDSQEHPDFDPAAHITNRAFGLSTDPGAPITCANNA